MDNDSSDDMIVNVMRVFVELKCAMEMWMTDKDWNGMGRRVLKEKVSSLSRPGRQPVGPLIISICSSILFC
jgi:hypothetical protein